ASVDTNACVEADAGVETEPDAEVLTGVETEAAEAEAAQAAEAGVEAEAAQAAVIVGVLIAFSRRAFVNRRAGLQRCVRGYQSLRGRWSPAHRRAFDRRVGRRPPFDRAAFAALLRAAFVARSLTLAAGRPHVGAAE